MAGSTNMAATLNVDDVSWLGAMANLSLIQQKEQGELTIGGESLPKILENEEWFFHWLKRLPLSKLSLMTTVEDPDTQSYSVCGLVVSISEWEPKIYEALKLLFYHALRSEYKKADDTEKKISNLVSNMKQLSLSGCDGNEQDLLGYLYLLKILKLYIRSKKGEYENKEDEPDFTKLSSASQLAVMRLKLMCLINFRVTSKLLSTAQKLAEMDPRNAKWHYYSYYYQRDVRRKASIRNHVTSMELAAIITAMDIDKNDTIFKVTGLQCLAETMRPLSNVQLWKAPLPWGVRSFASQGEIVDFLKNETQRLLQAPNVPAFCYNILGAIFSSFLPHFLLDLDLAENCMTKAIESAPNCSRVNHRMGLFIWKKTHDLLEASEYLRLASVFGPQNFYSRVDLIYLLMSKPKEEKVAITECFEDLEATTAWTWDNKEISELNFLKGCFILMTNGDLKEVIKLWIKAYILYPSASHFSTVAYQSRRFRWNKEEFNLDGCKHIIFSGMNYDGMSDKIQIVLNEMLMDLASQDQQRGGYDTNFQGISPRQTGELSRRTGESSRRAGESFRQTGESSRRIGESSRRTGESSRQTGESTRPTGESSRQTGESFRRRRELSRQTGESFRRRRELSRRTGESTRPTEELSRETGESFTRPGELSRRPGETSWLSKRNYR